MAIPAEIEWLNPISGEIEIVDGVLCGCYECKGIADNFYFEIEKHGIPFTKSEYREHQRDRQKQYQEYIIRKAERERAHTKETEALEGHGRPSSVTTRFDLNTGQLSSDDDRLLGNVRWETLWRASIQ